MTQTSIKSRRHLRFRTDLPAKIRQKGKFKWIFASMLNLSRGGICMTLSEPIPLGTMIELEIHTTSKTGTVNVRRLPAHVVWKRLNRYGIRFFKKSKN